MPPHTIDQLAAAAGLSARDLQQLLSIPAAATEPSHAGTLDEALARRLTDHMETTTRARLAAAR